ncbi:MAG TPA: FAD-binding oxidoreductase [Phenylobacterium sp.]|nr:FAD-binding oxidoreductase [Phenylobacterium sp.]
MAYRFLIIGAGMAGASAAARLAPHGPTLLLEAEAHPGYHATGRSAATYIDTYGAPAVCALTRASRGFFWSPPEGFAGHPLVRPIPELSLARPEQAQALAAHMEVHSDLRQVDAAEIRRMCPILRPEIDWSGALNDRVAELDVDAILQGFLRMARAAGAELAAGARVVGVERRAGGGWRVTTAAGAFEGEVVVNAAGAWAGEVGRLAGLGDLGLQPLRRTAVRIEPARRDGLAGWPFVVDVDERFYFKPESGGLLLSPGDETPSDPCDAQADELDVAYAVQAFEDATTEQVRRVAHRWAGLRTFAPDRVPVVGFDPRAEGFVWLAGQGGYGIQTAPALSAAAAGLVVEGRLPEAVRAEGVSEAELGPGRLLGA